MCAGDGIDGGGERRRAGDTPLMGEWRAGKWRAGWLNACPSLPILLVTGGLSFSPDWRISACLYMTARACQFACSTDNKRACACQNRWRCVTVSTQCCLLLAWPSTSRHVSFHNQGKGKMGRRNHPGFLPASFCRCLFGINRIPMPLAMLSPSRFLLFLVCFLLSLRLSLSPLVSSPCLCFGIKALKFKKSLFVCCFKITFQCFFYFSPPAPQNRDNEICLLLLWPNQCQKVRLLFSDARLFIFHNLNWLTSEKKKKAAEKNKGLSGN